MKYLLTFIVAFFISLTSYGNTYGVMTGKIGKVYYDGIVAGETQYQNQAIAFLCNEYIAKYYPKSRVKVFLELGFGESFSYKISYDKFQGEQWENAEQNRPAKGFGIRIRLSKNLNRAESVLKLLEYGLNNLADLRKASKRFFKMDYYDRPDELTVDSIALSEVINGQMDLKIKNILAIKVYRNLGDINSKVNKEYFFQNDNYYFVDFFNKDSIYLELKQVYQIITEYYLGTLIFETDSTGYFYSNESRNLSPKFHIINKQIAFYYTHTSSDNDKKRIYFEYNSESGIKKFIYLTDKLFLIQKVEEYEDEMIINEINKDTKG